MNNVITKSAAGVEQSDGRRDLAAALGHLFAGGDIRRKSWGQHSSFCARDPGIHAGDG